MSVVSRETTSVCTEESEGLCVWDEMGISGSVPSRHTGLNSSQSWFSPVSSLSVILTEVTGEEDREMAGDKILILFRSNRIFHSTYNDVSLAG